MSRAARSKGLASILVPVLLMIGLAGCGSQAGAAGAPSSGEPHPAAPAPSGLPPAEGKVAYPLALKTPWGQTTLSRRPRRIAAMGAAAADAELLAALGVTPVAVPSTIERSIWITSALPGKVEHVIKVDPDAGAPVEAIANAEPDLIIASGDDLATDYAKLSAIAPVLGVETEHQIRSSWRERIQAVGRVLDLEGAAQQVVAKHDAHLDWLRRANPQFAGKTATYAILYGGTYGLAYRSTPGSDTEKLLIGLGFSPNPRAQQFANDDTVSNERLTELDADVLLLSDNSENGDGTEMKELSGGPLWAKIPAVADKRAVIFHNTGESYIFNGKEEPGNIAWATSMSGPLADTWAADRLVPMLKTGLPAR